MPAPAATAAPATEAELAALALASATSLATNPDLAKASLAGVTIVLTVQKMGDVREGGSHAVLARAATTTVAGLRRVGPPTGAAEAAACLGSNAAAALSALVQAGDDRVVGAALEAGAVGVATALLAVRVETAAAALNYAALLGGLARSGGDAGALALVDGGALGALVAVLGGGGSPPPPHAPLLEAAADALCAVAACHAARDACAEAGVPGALAATLVSCAAAAPPDTEAGVRALLGLGMLCPGRPATAQAAVLDSPGALAALVSTMRAPAGGGGGDGDARVLARDLFAVLAAEGGEGRRAAMVGALQPP
jgi:hypothetical protein